MYPPTARTSSSALESSYVSSVPLSVRIYCTLFDPFLVTVKLFSPSFANHFRAVRTVSVTEYGRGRFEYQLHPLTLQLVRTALHTVLYDDFHYRFLRRFHALSRLRYARRGNRKNPPIQFPLLSEMHSITIAVAPTSNISTANPVRYNIFTSVIEHL